MPRQFRAPARRPPGLPPLLIGLHWPSLPWGDEDPSARAASFAPGEPDPIEDWIADAAAKLADTDRARAALRTLFTAARDDLTPDELPLEVVEAYSALQAEAGLGAKGPGGAPGDDIERFDAQSLYQEALEQEAAFGVPGVGPFSPRYASSPWPVIASISIAPTRSTASRNCRSPESKDRVAGRAPRTSPISGPRLARCPPACPEKMPIRAWLCASSALSSTYSATFQLPAFISPGECRSSAALSPSRVIGLRTTPRHAALVRNREAAGPGARSPSGRLVSLPR